MNLRETKRFRRHAWAAAFLALAACSPTLTDRPTALATADAVTSDATPPDVAAQTDTAPSETVPAGPLGQFSPALVDFGSVDYGKCVVKTASLSNWGSAPLTVKGLDLAALDQQFTVEWLSPAVLTGQSKSGGEAWLLAAPLVLQPYQSAGLSVRYCPNKAGPVAVQVPVLGDGGPLALAIQATGVKAHVPCMKASPGAAGLNFGNVLVGTSSEFEWFISNCGSMDLVVTKLQLIEDGSDSPIEFAVNWKSAVAAGIVGPGPISAANPLTIPVSGAVEFVITYTPANLTPAGQADTAKLTAGLSSGEQSTVALTGRGVAVQCPVAVAKVIQGSTVVPQTNLHLDGTASYSPTGAKITKFKWTVKQPLGSNQPLMPSATFPKPTIMANTAGEYEICLDVWDDNNVKSCEPSCVKVLALPNAAVHIEVLWNTPLDPDQTDSGPAAGADLDLHFAHPMASGLDRDCDGIGDPWFSNPWDAFWFNPNPSWGGPDTTDDPSLDLDDSDGAGPEILNLQASEGTNAEPVAYSIGVHYWNDHGYGPSEATVFIYVQGTLIAKLTTQLDPLDMWYVGKLHWPNTLSGGTKAPLETCYQTGSSCPAQKNLMWAPKGDYCVTPCYEDKAFSQTVGGAPSGNCKKVP